MGEKAELLFYADTPNAENFDPPSDLSRVADDVVEGLRLSLTAAGSRLSENPTAQEVKEYHDQINDSLKVFLRFIYEIQKTGHLAAIIPGPDSLAVDRLGFLGEAGYALFESVTLEPSSPYPLNYCGSHANPRGHPSRDRLADSDEYVAQYFVGYAEEDINYMGGYAISINHFLAALDKGARFGTISRPSPAAS